MFKHFASCGEHLVEASCAITAPLCRFGDCRSLGSQCYANRLSSFLKCSGMTKCNMIADIAKFQHNALNVKVRVCCVNYGEEGRSMRVAQRGRQSILLYLALLTNLTRPTIFLFASFPSSFFFPPFPLLCSSSFSPNTPSISLTNPTKLPIHRSRLRRNKCVNHPGGGCNWFSPRIVSGEISCALQYFFHFFRTTLEAMPDEYSEDDNGGNQTHKCNPQNLQSNSPNAGRTSCDWNDTTWTNGTAVSSMTERSTNGIIFLATWPAVAAVVTMESILHSLLFAGEMVQPLDVVVWRVARANNQPSLVHRLCLVVVLLLTICLAFGGGLQTELVRREEDGRREDDRREDVRESGGVRCVLWTTSYISSPFTSS